MAKPKRRRISDLYWIAVNSEPPAMTPEEKAELADAMLDETIQPSENLKYLVKVLRADSSRLNAAIEETEEQREARRAKDRERQARHRLSQMSQDVTNVTDVTERDERDNRDICDETEPLSRAVTPTNSLTNQLTNNNSCPVKPDMRKFVPPTIEDVAAYIKEKGYHFSAEAFVAFYESKGWMVGKNKMQKWKAACSTWEQGRGPQHQQQKPADLNGAGDRTGKDGRSAYDGLF